MSTHLEHIPPLSTTECPMWINILKLKYLLLSFCGPSLVHG